MRHVLPVEIDADPLALLGPLGRALDGTGPAVLPVAPGHPLPALAGPLAPDEDAADDPTALVVATSGSTGAPKGVLISARALRASAMATHERLGGPGRWLLATPALFIGGIQVLVRSMLAGAEPGVLDLRAGFRPEPFARAAEPVLATPGRHYTAMVPTQLARLVEAGGPGLAAARAFDAIVLGGAAFPHDLRRRTEDAGVRVVAAYGMSETASGCVYDGVPLDGVRFRLGDSDRVELSGPVLARGYRRRPDLTAASFVDGWFRTSDQGRVTAEGRLEVLGRIDDVINTGGVKVAPAAVERVLAARPGVREVCVVGVPDREWGEIVAAAVVPADIDSPPPVDALREAVTTELGPASAPKRVRFVDELPLRGPGKVDRATLRAQLR